MRISDWSSDVCSSDLLARGLVKDADAPFAIDAECTYLHFFLRMLALISTVSSGCRGSAAGWAGQRAVEIAQAPVLQAVNQAVHLELLPAAPGIEHDRRLGDAAHLGDDVQLAEPVRSEEHTSELQSLMRISYAVFCLKKTNISIDTH